MNLSIGERVIQLALHLWFRSSVRTVGLSRDMGLGLRLLLRGPIHGLECVTDSVEMQEFKMVQAIVKSIILMDATADKVGEMNEARVNEGSRGVAKDDRLELRDRIKGGELDEVRDELEPARADSAASLHEVTSRGKYRQ